MSAEENKALVRRFVEEFWNRGNTTAADELMASDAEIYMPTGEMLDPNELKIFRYVARSISRLAFHLRGTGSGRGQGGRAVDRSGHAPGRDVGHPSHRQAR
jgi:hypothetical protein